jgi:UDP-N-acetyl-2-amino-2-deoxyglucuronate dehydrogenase
MNNYKLGVLGCGAIFSRHLEAVNFNAKYFQIIGIYDPDIDCVNQYKNEYQIKQYKNEDELFTDKDINCIVILTPSGLHVKQIAKAISCRKNVIVEKPAGFYSKELEELSKLAKLNGVNIFTVLQVRLNPSIQALKKFITQGHMGKIRGVSLVQRWQRPINYFDCWRGDYLLSGGVLREFSIHYIDAMLYVLNLHPNIHASIFKNVKIDISEISDSISVLLDFDKFIGNIEVNIGAEPSNLECSLSIMSENGFVKLGGKSLDVIAENKFLDDKKSEYLNELYRHELNSINVKLATIGASPYHPELYYHIIHNPHRFFIENTIPVIELIDNIYSSA